MNIELRTITPEMSAHFLSKNTNNRKITEKNVTAIAHALYRGEWALNGETIKFDHDGNVIDGQHRLMACVRTGIPFQSYVVNNLPPESFTTIDIGSKRTAADILSIHHAPNSTNIASIAKCYIEARHNKGWALSRLRATNEQILAEYKTNPELYQKLAGLYQHISKFANTSFMAICKSAIEIYGDRWLESTISKIKTGQNLEHGDPCLALREWAINNKDKKTRSSSRAIYVKAVKAMATGTTIKMLRHNSDQAFPTLS